jgi:hypothetical protein
MRRTLRFETKTTLGRCDKVLCMTTPLPTYLHEPNPHLTPQSSQSPPRYPSLNLYVSTPTSSSSPPTPHHRFKKTAKRIAEAGGGGSSNPVTSQILHPDPSSHKTQFRPVPKNAKCCARRHATSSLIYAGMRTLANTRPGLMGRRNGQLHCPVCITFACYRPPRGCRCD